MSDIPAPEIVSTNGLAHIGRYVTRLLASQKYAAQLMLSSLDGMTTLSLLHLGGKTHFYLPTTWPQTPEQATVVRSFFARLGVTPEDKHQGEMCLLSFAVPDNQAVVADALTRILIELYSIRTQDGLKFRYEERNM